MKTKTALRRFGISRLAKECGVSPQATHKWANTAVPAERVLDVERITGISRHELRPDVFGKAA